MTTFESVLREARALSPGDRERLIIHMHWSLEPEDGPVDEATVVAELGQISRRADADSGALADWDASQREIFDSPAPG